ncbi:MAG TPA: glucose 1-dehydrogenase [Candidatus Binatia bacterium]|nr:glucose 1-dehydrogenase [Candidatus Binatia bacterium]
MGKLDRKVAVITGGASGMGAGTVRRFVEEGARVVIADITDERGRALAKELGAAATYVRADVSREDEVAAALALAVDRWGRLDCMFNNAGFGGVDEILEEIPVDGYQQTMDVLVKGVLLGIKHAAPIMKKQRSGSVINTGSVAGMQAGYGPHVYSAAKAAVIHLSRSAAMELGEWGVRVNCICPGGIVTPIFGKALGLPAEKADESLGAVSEALRLFQAVPRPGHPADIASAALFLASDDSTFINGHALVVDGGLTAGRRFSDAQESWNAFRELMGIPRKEFPQPA